MFYNLHSVNIETRESTTITEWHAVAREHTRNDMRVYKLSPLIVIVVMPERPAPLISTAALDSSVTAGTTNVSTNKC